MEVQDSEVVQPTSLAQAGSVPETEASPLVPTAIECFAFHPIDIRKVAKQAK